MRFRISQAIKINKRWLYVFLSIIIMLLLGTVYSYSVFRVALENEFMVGSAQSGMPYMTGLGVYALFMFFSGKHLDKFNPRNILILGGLLLSLGWVLSSFAPNIFFLTLTYGCISGAGVGIAYGVPMSVIAKWFPDKKGFAVGLILVGFGLSPLLTAPIAKYFVENYGVMKTFLIMGLAFGLLIPILSFAFKYPLEDEVSDYIVKNENNQKLTEVTLKEMIQTKTFKGIYFNFIIATMIGLTMIGMTTSIGLDYFDLDLSTIAKLIAIFAIFNGLGRPTFGWITDRYSPRKAILLSYMLVISSSLALVLLNRHLGAYLVTFSIFWFNLGGWLAIAPTSTLNLYGLKNYSQNYGLIFTAYGIGAIAGVSTSGILLDYHGNYDYLFYYIIGLCLLGIILTTKYMKKNL